MLNSDCLQRNVTRSQSIQNFLKKSVYNPNIEMMRPMILKILSEHTAENLEVFSNVQ